ncbi:tail fiber protein from prophage CP-933H [Escherichia coli]|nr:phage tail protein [Escherichia coli]EHN6777008.1 phage tail protein [Escherichia coli]EHN6786857.1 phage tail protein [Escherichia coli]EHQ1264935.1 phage tail protein [Escherichia coli]EHQ1274419.1 phage tail protein [Escherichia coli]
MPVTRYLCIFINVRLGAGAPSIGIPFFWPSAAMPNTVMDEWSDMVFLKWNDATFSAATYPKLAKVIPSQKLTESRGEFIRTWDDGRGVDGGRALLSAQGDAIRNIAGEMDFTLSSLATSNGVLYNKSTGTRYVERALVFSNPTVDDKWKDRVIAIDASRTVPTATENRPRSIAFNFLVRAK